MGKQSTLMKAHRKIQEKQEEERQEKAERFLAAYKKVVQETGIEWTCELEYTPRGISPRLRLAEARPPQVTSWAQAKKENLELRKNCTHVKREDNIRDCKTCGLPETVWGENGVGATEEYIKGVEEKIAELEKADAQKDQAEAPKEDGEKVEEGEEKTEGETQQ